MPPKGSPRIERAARLLIANDSLTATEALMASGYTKRKAEETSRHKTVSKKKRRLIEKDQKRHDLEKKQLYNKNRKRARKEKGSVPNDQERTIPTTVTIVANSTVSSLSDDYATIDLSTKVCSKKTRNQ